MSRMLQVENVKLEMRRELEDAPGGTLARIHARGDATGFFALAAPLMARMVHKNILADLHVLRDQLEAERTA